MEIKLEKQPRKYLRSLDAPTREKLERALDKLSRLEGNIDPIQGMKNRYRYKMDHYRIVFEWIKNTIVIRVIEINTRTNIHY